MHLVWVAQQISEHLVLEAPQEIVWGPVDIPPVQLGALFNTEDLAF